VCWQCQSLCARNRASISIVSGSWHSPSYQSAFHLSLTVLVWYWSHWSYLVLEEAYLLVHAPLSKNTTRLVDTRARLPAPYRAFTYYGAVRDSVHVPMCIMALGIMAAYLHLPTSQILRSDSGRTVPFSFATTRGISVDFFSSAELYA